MAKCLQKTNFLTITCNRKNLSIDIRTILYIQMHENMAEIHTSSGKVYKSLITLERLESILGDSFLKVHRSRLVSVMAIHDITDKVNLNNGERLGYVARRKKELTAALAEKRSRLIDTLDSETLSVPDDELHTQYRASMRCRLRSPISKWCSMMTKTLLTGFFDMPIPRLRGWKRRRCMS